MTEKKEGAKVLASNRKARHDYIIEDSIEAGVVLTGTEIKSLHAGRANLQDSFAVIRNGEAWLVGAHISPYSHGNRENHEPADASASCSCIAMRSRDCMPR